MAEPSAADVGAWHAARHTERLRLHAEAPAAVTRHGVALRLDEDWATPRLRRAIYDEEYEVVEARILEAALASGDRVLELGSGIGFLATLAARISGRPVRGFEADPAMAAAARRTVARNDADAEIRNAVLQRAPRQDHVAFYVHEDFWVSGLAPADGAAEISVPTGDLDAELTAHAASFLIVDIEGGETELLRQPLPATVRRVMVECHPDVSPPAEITAMLTALLADGFALDLRLSVPPVLLLAR